MNRRVCGVRIDSAAAGVGVTAIRVARDGIDSVLGSDLRMMALSDVAGRSRKIERGSTRFRRML